MNVFPFIIGCILSGITAAITIALPTFKDKILPTSQKVSLLSDSENDNSSIKNENIGLKAIYYLIYSTLHISTMLLIMTMNGYVVLTMLIAMTISYFFFGGKDLDGGMPVNCCASEA